MISSLLYDSPAEGRRKVGRREEGEEGRIRRRGCGRFSGGRKGDEMRRGLEENEEEG